MVSVRLVERPADDAAWSALVERHPRASVFHSAAWLRALEQTYGFEPFVLTTSPEGRLDNGLVACRVKGWTSRRLVSLPFSDHCDPLVDGPDGLPEMLAFLADQVRDAGWRSAELRPRAALPGEPTGSNGKRPFGIGARYVLHTLDLRPALPAIFQGFHPSSTQRAVRRAEREGVTCETGTSEALIASFYGLLRQSRRRHGLPPQPIAWFRNLAAGFGDRLAVHVASHRGRPIASVLTLSFGRTLVYKYGGSDARHHPLGGMAFLFWQVVQRAKASGLEALDLGRSDLDQPGLVAFKDHLGATRSHVGYVRCPAPAPGARRAGRLARVARPVVARLPDAALDLAGRLLYRHVG